MALTVAPTIRVVSPARPPIVIGRAFLRDGRPVATVPADWPDALAHRVAMVLNTVPGHDFHEACIEAGAFDLELYASVLSVANLAH
ncbi:MAG: hypothetical protein RL456_1950 [Pseudomonadota bacterium]|jgi:hypothetical protein